MNKVYNITTIKKWFSDKAINDNIDLSNGKMEALLYYAKGFYFIVEHEPLFIESFNIKNEILTIDYIEEEVEEIEEKDVIALDFVYNKMSGLEADLIKQNIVEELKILGFECGSLPNEFMEEFFSELYTKNFDKYPKKLDIKDSDIIMLISTYILHKYKVAFQELAK